MQGHFTVRMRPREVAQRRILAGQCDGATYHLICAHCSAEDALPMGKTGSKQAQ